jgi:hypothetical protein
VVTGAGDEVLLDVLLELGVAVAVGDAALDVAEEDGVEVAAVEASVVAPIDPSSTIAPHAMANVASVAATMLRRIRATRRARSASRARPSAARSVGGVGIGLILGAALEGDRRGAWEVPGRARPRPAPVSNSRSRFRRHIGATDAPLLERADVHAVDHQSLGRPT